MPALTAIISGDARPLEKELNRGANAAQTAAKRIQTALSTDALFLERQISAAKRAGVEWGQYDAQLKKVQTDLAKVNRELATQETLSAGGPAAASAGPAAAGAGGKLAGKIAKGAGHMEGVGGIVTELLVVSRELLNGNFSRLPGSISILVQRFGLLKVIISGVGLAWTAAIAGIVAGIAIFYNRINGLAARLAGFQLLDFKVEHIAKYLTAAGQAVEAWHNINDAARDAAEAYDSVTASAERHLKVLQKEFDTKKKSLEVDKANALANVHDPAKRAEIEKKFRVEEAKLAKEQRDAELQANIQKQKDLENDVYTKKAQAEAIQVSTEASEAEKERKLKGDADAAQSYLDERKTAGSGFDIGGKAAKAYYSSLGLSSETREQMEAADIASRKRAIDAVNKYDQFKDERGGRDRLRSRKKQLEEQAAEEAKSSTTLKYENANQAKDNAKADKDEMALALKPRAEENSTRSGGGSLTLTHNQRLGAYYGGPQVNVLSELKIQTNVLKAIQRNTHKTGNISPGNSRGVTY